MIPGFLQGTTGVLQVVNVLTRRLPRLALNNVRRDRRRGTAELIYKSISLVFGELSDRTVDLQNEPVRLLPDIEFPPGCQEYPWLSPSSLTCARASLLPVPLLRSPLPPNPRGHSLTQPLNHSTTRLSTPPPYKVLHSSSLITLHSLPAIHHSPCPNAVLYSNSKIFSAASRFPSRRYRSGRWS